jgi:hypothetical protein
MYLRSSKFLLSSIVQTPIHVSYFVPTLGPNIPFVPVHFHIPVCNELYCLGCSWKHSQPLNAITFSCIKLCKPVLLIKFSPHAVPLLSVASFASPTVKIYRTITVCGVFYGCEICSITLKKKTRHKFREGVVKRMQQVDGQNCMLNSLTMFPI